MNITERIHCQIKEMPEYQLVELLQFIEFLNYKQKIQTSMPERRYDFSDLTGRLEWQGNALNEQKRLRNEW